MKFQHSEENKNLIQRLERILENGSVSHAYIFEGSSCADKREFAQAFVKGILCSKGSGENCGMCSSCDKIDHGNHEDVFYLSGEEGNIKDAQIIAMQERLKTKPFGSRNIVIIEDCDTMTLRAQNRLLKTLEEPPGDSVILLLSENLENLTQTIQSRCVKYRIHYEGTEGYDFMMEQAQQVAEMAFARKPFYQLKEQTQDITKDPGKTAAFLDSLEQVYRDLLLEKEKGISLYKNDELMEQIHTVEAARRKIQAGVSPAYTIKDLLLKIGG